ncbi:helix-turn-helix transcriptional regulator [Arthrobacter russicus]|uniref:DNA-binding transcriptional regulator YafY n=1 Tax=Arthrobacter russicus TaxID=172040 RepID=A0ABU1JCD6_9MICC|nr:YafY family protein [Arthrobacter russicus]MDR6269551.1 putative DNA-binding transcriptional regulator YafY [Arthrobacter russicus]
MANTSSRSFRLLSLLQHHRFWPGKDLAEKLEVSLRTLRRDVERLRELGYPVQATRGSDGGYQLAPGASLPPLVVDDEEAVALAIGLRMAAQGAVSGIEDASISALAKVIQVMPAKLRRRVEALQLATIQSSAAPGPMIDANTLTTLAQACRDEERLEFRYTARSGEPSQRLVEPHRLVAVGRRWYLVAYDLSRYDWRSFRVDRLADPERTGARFRTRTLPARDASEFVQRSLSEVAGPQTYRVRLHAPLAEVRDQLGDWAQLDESGPGYCELAVTGDTPAWAAFATLSTGADFEVLDGSDLAAFLDSWQARIRKNMKVSAKP